MNINAATFLSTFRALQAAHVRYDIGKGVGKARPLSCSPSQITSFDCSGFVQYMIYQCTDPHTRIPSGSWYQEQFFRDNAQFTRVDYATNACKNDDILRIGFRDRTDDMVRHVWFVINGFTYESTTRRGRDGPTSFHWSERTEQASDFFEIGTARDFLWIDLCGGQVA